MRPVSELVPQVRHDALLCHLPDTQERNRGTVRRTAKHRSTNMLPQRLIELSGSLVPDSCAAEPLEACDVCGNAARSIKSVILEHRPKEFRAAHVRLFPDDPDAQDPVLISVVVGK